MESLKVHSSLRLCRSSTPDSRCPISWKRNRPPRSRSKGNDLGEPQRRNHLFYVRPAGHEERWPAPLLADFHCSFPASLAAFCTSTRASTTSPQTKKIVRERIESW